MVEITYENVAPVLGLLLIGVTAYGAARKFTEMDKDIRNDQEKNDHDIAILENDLKRLQSQVDSLRHDVKDMHTVLIRLQQKIEDKFTK